MCTDVVARQAERAGADFLGKVEDEEDKNWSREVQGSLAGNVADMSRHVADDTSCRSNFGQMGPCRQHFFWDVVAVCVGLSRHLPDF